jgi:hypothetical protein
MQLQELSYQKQRANTVYATDDQLALKYKEIEAELNALRNENTALNNHTVELNAQNLKLRMDAAAAGNSSGGGKHFIVNLTTQNNVVHKGPSLADELDKMSNNEVLETLRTEQQITQRLKEYIDNILTRIMEHSPELLEKCLMR